MAQVTVTLFALFSKLFCIHYVKIQHFACLKKLWEKETHFRYSVAEIKLNVPLKHRIHE